jgi:hypothetical protein
LKLSLIIKTIKPFKGQNFYDLKAAQRNKLFEDPLFPADNQSLCFNRNPPEGIVWIRPKVSLKFSDKKLFD